jgi:hypothetical protein
MALNVSLGFDDSSRREWREGSFHHEKSQAFPMPFKAANIMMFEKNWGDMSEHI